jgi:hypothetical protein
MSLIGRAIGAGLGACALLWGGMATAQSCTSYPYTFSTGATAYAAQVNANFACAALTGNPVFSGQLVVNGSGIVVQNSGPFPFMKISGTYGATFQFYASNGSTDQKWWDEYSDSKTVVFRGVNDAYSAATTWLQVNRGS